MTTQFAHVTGSSIARFGLPRTLALSDGRTVSNPERLAPAVLAAEGWLPITGDAPTPTPGEIVTGPTYTVHSDHVEAVYTLAPAPPVDPAPEISERFGPRARILYTTGTERFVTFRFSGDPQARRLWVTMPGQAGPVTCDSYLVPASIALTDVLAVAQVGIDRIEEPDTGLRAQHQAGTLTWTTLPDEVLADVVAETIDPAMVAAAVTQLTSGA